MKRALSWMATILSIGTTFLRALNVGYVSPLYLLSCVSYAIMCYYERDRRLLLLNGFYFIMGMVAALRWS